MKTFYSFVAAAALMSGVSLSAYAADYSETVAATTGPGIIQMSQLDLSPVTCFDDAGKTKVRSNLTTLGDPIVLKGVRYESGVGTHAPSKAVIDLGGATGFHTLLGVDDDASSAANHGIVDYTVTLYKNKSAEVKSSGTVKRTDATPLTIDLDVTGYDYLVLDYATGAQAWADQCLWADARFTYSGNAPTIITEGEMYADPSNPSVVYLPEQGPEGEEIVPLSSLDISKITTGWGTVKANKSIDGNPLKMKGITYMSGVGTHATAKVNVKLNGAVTAFHAVIGIDDETKAQSENDPSQGICDYSVQLIKQNGEVTVFDSGTIRYTDTAPVAIDITQNLRDYKYLILEFPEGAQNGNDHVDIANAYFEYVEQNSTRPELVTDDQMSGALNCATIMFSQPGVRFMHKLRSNNSDAIITVSDLPDGLSFNKDRCLVEGTIDTEGDYTYTVSIESDGEKTEVPVSLTVSSHLQQPVPFMGWLSWNVVQGDISENVIKTVSDAFISQGLLDAGYNYLVIDDLWHANSRNSDSTPAYDPAKFPNGIKPCADYVHSKGLKFGIYSDGGTHTCAGKFGSYGYETIDANTYAEWGVDLLKYDYCNAPADLTTCKARYKAMGDALKASGRNILFYICEWGVREPWKWGPETGGTCWRATYDTRDGWNGKNGGIGIVESMEGMKDLWPYSGVNRFNDADMMCVGIHGTGKSSSDLVQKPGMTQDEYRTQFALWCMWSSPLTLSFDLRKPITDDDLALMTNPELIAINQDRMGQAAEFVEADAKQCYLFFKDLENGDVAVSVTNMSASATSYTIDFAKIAALNPSSTYTVRDLQARTDCPDAKGSINIETIKSHETKVYRLSDKNAQVNITSPTAAMDKMTVSETDGTVTICLPGTGSTAKRVLLSDTEGHVIASATSTDECISLSTANNHGVFIANVVCAGRSHSAKIIL